MTSRRSRGLFSEMPNNEMEASPEMSPITELFAGVAVSNLDVSIDWYTRFIGGPRTIASATRSSGRSRCTPRGARDAVHRAERGIGRQRADQNAIAFAESPNAA